tara:strand:- start:45 stop:509 length:465 start_codon:yes stop_codon:yes gene_type:complete
MKNILYTIILCFLFLFVVFADEDCGSKNNPSNYPNPIMCSEHIVIMKSFVDTLENGNIDKVVNSIDYPITFWKSGKEILTIEDSEQFKNFYEYIFPKHMIERIVRQFSNDNEYFWKNGRMMFGAGAIWFDLESGKVYVINHYDPYILQKLISKI